MSDGDRQRGHVGTDRDGDKRGLIGMGIRGTDRDGDKTHSREARRKPGKYVRNYTNAIQT